MMHNLNKSNKPRYIIGLGVSQHSVSVLGKADRIEQKEFLCSLLQCFSRHEIDEFCFSCTRADARILAVTRAAKLGI